MLIENSRLLLRRPCTFLITQKAGFQFHANNTYEDPIKNTEFFKIPNRLGGVWEHHKLPKKLLDNEFNYPVCVDTLGIRYPGYWFRKKFVYVAEMEPELIVPDLTDFKLKPYVSHKTEEVYTKPFTAKDLFDRVYSTKVEEAFKRDKLEELQVPEEQIDEARLRALQTGADLFEEYTIHGVRAKMEHVCELR